jgi:2,3-bisphosphoglycerate-independent phosphoglycerate mutase
MVADSLHHPTATPIAKKPRSVLLLFVDGVGVGLRDAGTNPFARLPRTLLGRFHDECGDAGSGIGSGELPAGGGLLRGGFWKPIDATLGVPGLPQSATGQATILTGVNVPREVGGHVAALPDRRVRRVIEDANIFGALLRAGRRPTFANAYTRAFFERRRPHISATTRAVMAAGLPFRMIEDLEAGRAVYHDYTNRHFPAETTPLAPRSAAQAADILIGLAREHDFTLHEHFLTDLAGHRGSEDERERAAARIEELVLELARRAPAGEVLFLAVSDHGNLEDSTTRSHTMNPVPLLAWGPGADEAIAPVRDLAGVTPSILRLLGTQ